MGMRFAFQGNETVGSYVTRRLKEAGWEKCDDVSSADAVFTYFTYVGKIEDAYFDEDGLLKNAAPKSLMIDLSPSTPSFARELSAVAAVHDFRVVEAPIAINDPTLVDAFSDPSNITCFVAGEKDDVQAALEPLGALAGSLVVLEGSGSAQLAKAVDTVQRASQFVAAIESEAMFRSWQESTNSVDRFDGEVSATTPVMRNVLAAIAEERFEGSFTIEMCIAEVAAAMTAADDVELILPQLEACMHLLELLIVVGGPDLSPAAMALMYRDEESSAEYGLEWSRAQGLFEQDEHGHVHSEDFDEDDYGFYGDMDDSDGLGSLYDGLGGYSRN